MLLPPEPAPRRIADLPHALRDGQQFAGRLAGRRPAVASRSVPAADFPRRRRPDRAAVSRRHLGDDITDEDAFRVLNGKAGIGVVADVGDPGVATTAADFMLESIGEVERFLNALAH